MFTNILKWAFKVGEKEIHVLLDHDTSTAVVKEVAYLMLKQCGQIEDQVKAKQEADEAAKAEQESKPLEVVD